jgi:23S rRNA-/tRNA-specific pseudouridylate synthase
VEYYEPKFTFAEAQSWYPAFKPEYVIHQQDGIAFVFKPAKLPTLAAKEQRKFSLQRALDDHFGKSVHLPSRLDMSASGLVIVGVEKHAHRVVQRLFEKRAIKKLYLFATSGSCAWSELVLNASIKRDAAHPILRKVAPGGVVALTHFAACGGKGDRLIFEASPYTGRTHQIRLHAAHLGLPIIGDNFYDGAEAESLHLFSYRLRFTHPETKQLIDVRIPDSLLPSWIKNINLQYSPILDRDV